MNHTPTPYEATIEADTDAVTIISSDGEVIAHCGSKQVPTNQINAAFIVRACNAYDELVKTLERVKANLTVDTLTRLGIYKALKLAYGE